MQPPVRPIANDDLKPIDMPPANASWGQIGRFALTFDSYAAQDSVHACSQVARQVGQRYAKHQTLPDGLSLTTLRTCLFFEQRRWRHYGEVPSAEAMQYIKLLVETIRERARDNA